MRIASTSPVATASAASSSPSAAPGGSFQALLATVNTQRPSAGTAAPLKSLAAAPAKLATATQSKQLFPTAQQASTAQEETTASGIADGHNAQGEESPAGASQKAISSGQVAAQAVSNAQLDSGATALTIKPAIPTAAPNQSIVPLASSPTATSSEQAKPAAPPAPSAGVTTARPASKQDKHPASLTTPALSTPLPETTPVPALAVAAPEENISTLRQGNPSGDGASANRSITTQIGDAPLQPDAAQTHATASDASKSPAAESQSALSQLVTAQTAQTQSPASSVKDPGTPANALNISSSGSKVNSQTDSANTVIETQDTTAATGTVTPPATALPLNLADFIVANAAGVSGVNLSSGVTVGSPANPRTVKSAQSAAPSATPSSPSDTTASAKNKTTEAAATPTDGASHATQSGTQHASSDPSQSPASDPKAVTGISQPPVVHAVTHDASAATRTPVSQADTAKSSEQRADLAAAQSESSAAQSSGVNTARVIQSMSESEMRVGMHSAEFGDISIRTSISQQQMLAQISVGHGDLSQAIASHVSTMQTKLENEYGLHASIEVHQSGSSFSSESGQSGAREQRASANSSRNASAVSVVDTESSFIPAGLAPAVDTYRLDVRA